MSTGVYNYPQTLAAATISSTAVSILALRAAGTTPNKSAITAISIGVETNNVRMGGPTITTANGTLLEAGTKLFLDASNPDLWFIASGSDASLQLAFFYSQPLAG